MQVLLTCIQTIRRVENRSKERRVQDAEFVHEDKAKREEVHAAKFLHQDTLIFSMMGSVKELLQPLDSQHVSRGHQRTSQRALAKSACSRATRKQTYVPVTSGNLSRPEELEGMI